ncbi:MAG: hypothetical protein ACE5IK_06060 [Acidobacteriota bacterium]
MIRTRGLAGLTACILVVGSGTGCVLRPPSNATAGEREPLQLRAVPATPFRAALQGRIRGSAGRARFAVGLGAVPPDLRVDLFHPVSGETILSVGVDGNALRAVWPGSAECFEGRPSTEVMGWILGIAVPPAELLALLDGSIVPAGSAEVVARRPLTGGQQVRIDLAAPGDGTRWRAVVDRRRRGGAREGVRYGNDGVEIRVSYPRWSAGTAGFAGHPEAIRLRVQRPRLRLDLDVREWAAGGPPRAALLPRLPAGCSQLTEGELTRRGPGWASRRRR